MGSDWPGLLGERLELGLGGEQALAREAQMTEMVWMTCLIPPTNLPSR